MANGAWIRWAGLLAAALLTVAPLAAQDLRGHGGPVRALAVTGQGQILSGSFDTRAILWDGAIAVRITRHHQGAVTAVLPLQQGRFATGGQDGRVAVWGEGPEPLSSDMRHPLPVGALAAVKGGIASAGWDGQIALSFGTPEPLYFKAHDGQITGLVAYRGGLASVGSDLRLRFWGQDGGMTGEVVLAVPASALATDGQLLFLAAPDGTVQRVAADGAIDSAAVSERPLLSVAVGGGHVAIGSTTGDVWLLDPQTLAVTAEISTGQGPVWALAITQGTLLTGGNDGLIRRWSLEGTPLGEGGSAPDPTLVNPRGAQVFRACAVCHTLTPDDGARAGPTLHGIFGRRIATAQGYEYSEALKSLDIVWTADTISKLFEVGPDVYTPGSRMPEQRVPSVQDRRALITFLETASR